MKKDTISKETLKAWRLRLEDDTLRRFNKFNHWSLTMMKQFAKEAGIDISDVMTELCKGR